MNIGVVFDAGSAAYASVRIEFFRSLLAEEAGCRIRRNPAARLTCRD